VSFKSTTNDSQLFEPQKNCSAEHLNEAMLSEELHLVVHPAALGPHRQHHCLGRFLSGCHGIAEAETSTLVSPREPRDGKPGIFGDFGRDLPWKNGV